MAAFFKWLFSLFGITPTVIPPEVIDETTAHVDPEDYDVENVTDEEVQEILDELDDLDDSRKPSKFAVLIGINIYDPSLNADLNGCVNDVENMYKILTEVYDFPHDNIRMLTDDRATQNNIIDRIAWLMNHNIPGDELVLHYSGHGSQVRDRGLLDELNDHMDEILCPHDLDWDDPLVDDTIRFFFDKKGEGVSLTFVCDSCHSGSITKSTDFNTPAEAPKIRYIQPPLDIKVREGDNPITVQTIGGLNIHEREWIEQDHVLLSGCRDDQTSADAFIDGTWQGAMTSSLIRSIKNNPNRDWTNIHADVISILNAGGYTQKPQLSGEDSLVKGRTIFGS